MQIRRVLPLICGFVRVFMDYFKVDGSTRIAVRSVSADIELAAFSRITSRGIYAQDEYSYKDVTLCFDLSLNCEK
jgi:hypothetical protein